MDQIAQYIFEQNTLFFKKALDDGLNPDYLLNPEMSALMLCIETKYQEGIRLLLTAGADVNLQVEFGYSALWTASAIPNTSILAILLNINNVNVNIQTNLGDTPLVNACIYSYYDNVEMLIKKGANVNLGFDDINIVPLMTVKDFRIARLLIDNGANVNAKTTHGHTPLMYMIKHGHLDIAYLLIESGVDINAKSVDFETAMEIACENNSIDAVVMLLANGADIPVFDLSSNKNIQEILSYASNMKNMSDDQLSFLFNIDPLFWTSVAKYQDKRVFEFFKRKYADILGLSKDVVGIIFEYQN